MKLCVNCKHFFENDKGEWCIRGGQLVTDLVTGNKVKMPGDMFKAREERYNVDSVYVFRVSAVLGYLHSTCGKSGKYFEVKENE